jgi:serine O-acetyltransferase
MWAVVSYRFRRWLYVRKFPGPLGWAMKLIAALVQLATEILTHVQIPSSAVVGPGLYVPHTGCIVVSSAAQIGSNCTLGHGVTIGHAGGGGRSADRCPVIGDRVYLGPGSAIIGPIQVGNDALIGVGAVVTRSVPPRAVIAGNPGRVLSLRGSFDLISYPGMDHDEQRRASLSQLRRSVDPVEVCEDFDPSNEPHSSVTR